MLIIIGIFLSIKKNELLLIKQNKSPVAESHLHMPLKHCGEFSKTFPLLGVNFTNISRTYFLPADPKSAKRNWWLYSFLHFKDLWAQKLLVKLSWNWPLVKYWLKSTPSPGHTLIIQFKLFFLNAPYLRKCLLKWALLVICFKYVTSKTF